MSDADTLDMLLDREVILLAGDAGSGKSYSVAKLIEDGLEQDFQVVVLDRDRGLVKAIKEVFGKGNRPANLTYTVAKTWGDMVSGVDGAMENLGPGDWMVFEQAGAMWDFAQSEYSREVYGEGMEKHLIRLRVEAQELIDAANAATRATSKAKREEANKILGQKMAYSGMEGRTDWPFIKRMHNDMVFARAIVEGDFNILTTTSLTAIGEQAEQKRWYKDFEGIGKRPEGEKHQIYRHDTIVIVEHKGLDSFTWRTDLGGGRGKDRGRELVRDIDFTDIGFVASYLEEVEE